MINKAIIVGRLGADPEARFTPGGKAVTSFRVATERHWKDGDGQSVKETEWHTILVWERLAELCNQYLQKGSLIHVEGRLQTRSWDDKEHEGVKHYRTEIVASEVKFLDRSSNGAAAKNREGCAAVRHACQPGAEWVYAGVCGRLSPPGDPRDIDEPNSCIGRRVRSILSVLAVLLLVWAGWLLVTTNVGDSIAQQVQIATLLRPFVCVELDFIVCALWPLARL